MSSHSIIQSTLDRVRPILQADGGDVELVDHKGREAAPAQTASPMTPSPGNTRLAPVPPPSGFVLDDHLLRVEAELIRWALTESRGNKSQAAALLGVKRSTFGDRVHRCGVDTK